LSIDILELGTFAFPTYTGITEVSPYLVSFTSKLQMAENTYKSNTFKKPEEKKKGRGPKSKSRFNFEFFRDPRLVLATGFFLIITSLYLFIAFLSYLFTGKADQSVVEALTSSGVIDWGKEAKNWLGLGGAWISHVFIFRYLGISAFFIPPLLFLGGLKLVSKREPVPIFSVFIFSVFAGLWLCLLLGYLTHSISGITEVSFLSGGLGYQLALISDGLFGWGTLLILVLSLFIFIIYYFNVTAIHAFQVRDPKPIGNNSLLSDEDGIKPAYTDDLDNWPEVTSKEEPEASLEIKAKVKAEPLPVIKLEVETKKPELRSL